MPRIELRAWFVAFCVDVKGKIETYFCALLKGTYRTNRDVLLCFIMSTFRRKRDVLLCALPKYQQPKGDVLLSPEMRAVMGHVSCEKT